MNVLSNKITVESLLFEPLREAKVGWKNRNLSDISVDNKTEPSKKIIKRYKWTEAWELESFVMRVSNT